MPSDTIFIHKILINWRIEDADTVQIQWRNVPNTDCICPSAHLAIITGTTVITFFWPCPFESLLWLISTITFILPLKTCIYITFRSANFQADLNSHFFISFKMTIQNSIVFIIECTRSMEF